MNDSMRKESERLETFQSAAFTPTFFDKSVIAKNGFFFVIPEKETETKNKSNFIDYTWFAGGQPPSPDWYVQCFACKRKINLWLLWSSFTAQTHGKHSADCPYQTGEVTGNIPLEDESFEEAEEGETEE
jgi:hypothetical protein